MEGKHVAVVAGVLGVLVITAVVLTVTLAGKKKKSSSASGDVRTAVLQVTDPDGIAITGATVSVSSVQGATDEKGQWPVKLRGETTYRIYVTAANPFSSDPAYFQPQDFNLTTPTTDTTAPFIVPVKLEGWSTIIAHPELRNAVSTARTTAQDQSVTITYSFANEGTSIESGGTTTSVTLKDYSTNPTLTNEQFVNQIEDGLDQIKDLFETLFRREAGFPANVTVTFQKTTETASAPGMMDSYTVGDEGTGALRFFMYDFGGDSMTLAQAYAPHDLGAYASDVMFNSKIDWRPDTDVEDQGTDGGFSVLYITVHEVLHALGVGHHASSGALMYPVASRQRSLATRFPGGLKTSKYEQNAIRGIFDS